MSTPLKILGGAGALIVAALVGGTLIGSALAAPSTGSSGPGDSLSTLNLDENAAEYCQTFLDTFASELGVSTDDLVPAAKAAAIAAVNAAVDAGDLTQDRADAMIERINNWDGSGCGWVGLRMGLGGPGHGPRVELMSGMFSAAADEMGMTTAELRDALVDNTLEEVASDEGVDYADVVAAALASAKSDLEDAVAAGTITQDQADTIYDRFETWLNEGEIGNWGSTPGPMLRHGGWFFGPPPDSSDGADSSDSSNSSSTEGTSA